MHKLYDDIQLDEMNPDILSGIARKLGSDTPGFIDDLWRHSLKSLPADMKENDVIRYLGYDIIPIEKRTMKEKSTIYSPGRKSDIAPIKYPVSRSNSIPINFKFQVKRGDVYEDAYAFMRVPYIGRNGIVKLSGTDYYVTPVLSDVLITPDKGGVFVKPDTIKFKVKTVNVTITYYGPDSDRFDRILTSIVVSDQMRGDPAKSSEQAIFGSPKLPVHLYIIYKFGLEEVYGKEIHIIHEKEVESYHKNGYHIYSVPSINPKGHLKWVKSEYLVAVKEQPDGNDIKVISSVLQVLYFFPSSGRDMVYNLNTANEAGYWEVAIGRMIYKGLKSESFTLREVRNLFAKFQTFISGRIASKLEGIGFEQTTDFFVFLRELLEKLDSMKASHLEYVNSFSHREIDIYYYLLFPYIVGITKIMNAISKSWKSGRGFTRDQFYGITTKEYSNETLLRKISKSPIALTLSKMEASSDNIAFKMTTTMIPQEIGKGVDRKASNKNQDIIPKNMQGLHASFSYIGNLLKLSNSVPVALGSINPFINIDTNGRFVFTDEDKFVMEKTDSMLNATGRDIDNADLLTSDTEVDFD